MDKTTNALLKVVLFFICLFIIWHFCQFAYWNSPF